LTISGRLNLLRLHGISTTQPECLAKMVRTREFSRKVQNEDFQSRPSNKFFEEGQSKGISRRSKYNFSMVETRICLEFKLNIGFNIVKMLIFLLMVYKRKSRN
jgi:hypothetical protein